MASKRKKNHDDGSVSKKRKLSNTVFLDRDTNKKQTSFMINHIFRQCGFKDNLDNIDDVHEMENIFNQSIAIEIIKSVSEEDLICHLLDLFPYSEEYLRLKCLKKGVLSGLLSKLEIVGSTGDGSVFFSVSGRSSDVDLLYELHSCTFLVSERLLNSSCTHRMKNILHLPGYVFLQSVDRNEYLSFFDEIDRRQFELSEIQCDEEVFDILISCHGPAVCVDTLNKFYGMDLSIDFIFAIKCNEWPSMAKEWITRKRKYDWPSRKLIKKLSRSGCHLVPVGIPGTNLENFQWRVSFAVTEKKLLRSVNIIQFKVYVIFKMLIKQILSYQTSESPISSYVIKTTVFWVLEESDSRNWQNINILTYLRLCCKKLCSFLKLEFCPNYFMTQCNLFYKKIKDKNLKRSLNHALMNLINEDGLIAELRILYNNHRKP